MSAETAITAIKKGEEDIYASIGESVSAETCDEIYMGRPMNWIANATHDATMDAITVAVKENER